MADDELVIQSGAIGERRGRPASKADPTLRFGAVVILRHLTSRPRPAIDAHCGWQRAPSFTSWRRWGQRRRPPTAPAHVISHASPCW